MNIQTTKERARQCGFRSKGLYLKMDSFSFQPCAFFPQPSRECDCCGLQLKPVRAIAMRPTKAIFGDLSSCKCVRLDEDESECCGFYAEAQSSEEFLLDWIGADYKTPKQFLIEAAAMGISRKISGIPAGFVPGETTIVLGHKAAYDGGPGFFASYRPDRIEYVIGGDESEEKLQEMYDKGIRIVDVQREYDEQAALFGFSPTTGIAEELTKYTVDGYRDILRRKHPVDYDIVEKILNDNISKGAVTRLATKIYSYLVKDLERPVSRANTFKEYAKMRIEEYKKDLQAQ